MNSAFESIYTRVFTKRYSSLIQNSLVVSNRIIGKSPQTSAHTDPAGIKLLKEQAH